MADLAQIYLSSPAIEKAGLTFTLLEEISRDSARVGINNREITFVYEWEKRFDPHWEYFGDFKVRLANTFKCQLSTKPETAFVFCIEAAKTMPKI